MKPIRAFFAIPLPKSAQALLGKLLLQLQKNFPENLVRWSMLPNLHVTLHFLPKLNLEHVPELIYNTTQALRNSASFFLSLEKLVLFTPKIIALEAGPTQQLTRFASLIGQAIHATNYPIDERPFRGHLTLGVSFDSLLSGSSISRFVVPKLPTIPIQQITLFESRPGKNCSTYIPLA